MIAAIYARKSTEQKIGLRRQLEGAREGGRVIDAENIFDELIEVDAVGHMKPIGDVTLEEWQWIHDDYQRKEDEARRFKEKVARII